jgi:deoxyadenosine/deoxycytidine kinase
MIRKEKVIIVEGIIGAGKSSITRELGVALDKNTLVLLEPDEKDSLNPYLSRFYEDPERWALTMQVHLLQTRYRMHLQAQWHAMNGYGYAILDRSYFGDTAFARLQLQNETMSQDEFNTYKSIYHAMTASVLLPNVCIRLLVSPKISLKRINKRKQIQTGRRCESVITLDYLQALDHEIQHMIDVLAKQGVTIIDVPWDEDRSSEESRSFAVKALVERIRQLRPVDGFLDLHRRTI